MLMDNYYVLNCVADLCITPIPMLMDNYSYLVTDTKHGSSIVVDPGDPEPVLVKLILNKSF